MTESDSISTVEVAPHRGLRGPIARSYRVTAVIVVTMILGSVIYNYQRSRSNEPLVQEISRGNGINLLSPTEHFQDAQWGRDKALIVSSPASPPLGTGRAERLIEDDGQGAHRILLAVSGLTPESIHTFSVFVKMAPRTGIRLEARDDPMKSYGRVDFDLEKAQVIRSGDIKGAGMVPIANGWYRAWMSMAYNTGRAVVDIGLIDDKGTHDYLGDGKSGVDLWGPQFELGGLGLYALTREGSSTPVAHSDSPETGLNLLWPSESFSDARWELEQASLEPAGSAPDGIGKGEHLFETDGDGFHRMLTKVSGLTPGAVHTFSVFVRPKERNAVMLEARDDPFRNYGRVGFDTTKKALIFRTDQVLDAAIEPVGAGWFRCWMTMAYTADRAVVDVALLNGDQQRYSGNPRSGIELSGAQFELGGRPGKYAQTIDGPTDKSR